MWDFETRSSTPIEKGLTNYFNDPDFKVLCGAYKFDGKPAHSFFGEKAYDFCRNLYDFSERYPFVAFNSAMEAHVFAKVLNLPVEDVFKRFYPLELVCKYLGGPDKLEKCLSFFKVKEKKDPFGKKLIEILSVPYSDKTPHKEELKPYVNEKGFVDHPRLFKRFKEYCEQDVVASEKLLQKIVKYGFELKPLEAFNDNYLNFLRNRKGVRFDMKRVKSLNDITLNLEKAFKQQAKTILGDPKFNLNSSHQIKKILAKHRLNNTRSESLKPVLEIEKSETLRDIIRMRLNRPTGATSVLKRVLQCADKDGIVTNSFRFWGAGQTGRFTSYGANPLVWPRSSDIEKNAALLRDKENLYGKNLSSAYNAVKAVMRTCIIPHKGCVFYGGDFSQIEFRLLMLVVGDVEKLKKLYRGWDAYVFIASKVFHKSEDSVTTEERYIAKRVTLALGYGMGPQKAKDILWGEGVFVTEEIVRAVFKVYRQNFPLVTSFSYKLERSFNGSYLTVPITKRKIRLFECQQFYGKYGPYWTYKSALGVLNPLPKHKMVGWLIQSLACDIFKAVIRNLYVQLGLDVVIPFHDEVVCSIPVKRGKPVISMKDFKKVLGQSPDFIKNYLPYIQTETWKGGYYAK